MSQTKRVPRPGTPLPTGDTTTDTPALTKNQIADSDSSRVPRQCSAETRPWRRRRMASQRMVPLASGVRDPWQRWRPETLSEKQVAGAVDAARHLLDIGCTPIFDPPTLRAMWTAGHHQLVNNLRGGGR